MRSLTTRNLAQGPMMRMHVLAKRSLLLWLSVAECHTPVDMVQQSVRMDAKACTPGKSNTSQIIVHV